MICYITTCTSHLASIKRFNFHTNISDVFYREKERKILKMASEEGQVIGCHTVDEWKAHFQRGVETKKLVVVDFTASWCGPCRFIAPILAEIAKKTPHVIFLKVDVDELKSVSEEYKIEAMPTFLFIKDGQVIDKIVGAKKDELQAKVGLHSASTASA